jgi:hypothetical protein
MIAEDGSYTLEYYSVDRVGNTEPTQSTSFQVDTEVPSGAMITPDGLIVPSVLPVRFLARGSDPPAPNGYSSGLRSACFEVTSRGAAETVGCFEAAGLPGAMWGTSVALERGSYTVTWVMQDQALNEFRSSPITLTVV